jgi:hypothetical protein
MALGNVLLFTKHREVKTERGGGDEFGVLRFKPDKGRKLFDAPPQNGIAFLAATFHIQEAFPKGEIAVSNLRKTAG